MESTLSTNRDLRDLDVLISGQLITAYTSTVESYLKDRANVLAVIGLTGAFVPENVGRISLYRRGKLICQVGLPSVRIRRVTWYTQPLLLFVFANWAWNIALSILRLRRRWNLFIGRFDVFNVYGADPEAPWDSAPDNILLSGLLPTATWLGPG